MTNLISIQQLRTFIFALGFFVLLSGCGKDGFKVVDSTAAGVDVLAKPSYDWEISLWSACSTTVCGNQGTQYRTVVCKKNGSVTVSDSFCGTKPATSQTCSALCSSTTTSTLPPATTTTLAPTTTTAAPTTTTLPPVTTTTTTLPPTSGTAPIELIIVPSFKTAGIIAKLPASSASNVSAKIYYKKSADAGFQEGYALTKYDLNNMATSLFSLDSNTSYDLRVDYNDGSGSVTSKMASFRTKADPGTTYPAALRTINVSTLSQLQSAVNSAIPGDHIVISAGVYLGRVTVSNKIGTAANPIVIRGANYFDPFNPGTSSRAILDGNLNGIGVSIRGSAHIILDNVEIRNAGAEIIDNYNGYGVEIYSSSQVTIQRSYIHDNGHYNIRIDRSDVNTAAFGGLLKTGYHLIQSNFVTDTSDRTECDAMVYPYTGCTGITYEGIAINKLSGGGNVIRGNRITNMIDAITLPGDGAMATSLTEDTAHVLKLTNSTGIYMNHDHEVYSNEIFANHDDDIECDGIGVNIRIHNNTLGSAAKSAHHALTAAPFMPGPLFIIRNTIKGFKKSALKMNTGGSPSIPSRNVYVYHNTFVKPDGSGTLLNLWYGGSGSTGYKNAQFKNNIFYAPNGARCTDINTSNYGGAPATTLNHNLWYTSTSSSSLFEWYNGSTIQSASSLAGFRTISGQEANGIFALPALNSNYSLQGTSPAIDKGVRIPGINNIFNGAAPDMGAMEY